MLLRLAYPMKIVTKVKRWCIWWLALARVSDCVCLQWIKKLFKQLVQSIGLRFPLSPLPLSSLLPLFFTSPSLPLFLPSLLNYFPSFSHSSFPPPSPFPTSLLPLPQKHSKVGHVFNQTFWYQLQLSWGLRRQEGKNSQSFVLEFLCHVLQQRNRREIPKCLFKCKEHNKPIHTTSGRGNRVLGSHDVPLESCDPLATSCTSHCEVVI